MATEKLISADSLQKAFLRHMAKRFDRELCASGENCKGCYPGCSWRYILEMEPAVDAVEVVRCKDCKHGLTEEYKNLYTCDNFPDGIGGYIDGECYCSYGERKKEDI